MNRVQDDFATIKSGSRDISLLGDLAQRFVNFFQPCETDPWALAMAFIASIGIVMARTFAAQLGGPVYPHLYYLGVGVTSSKKERIITYSDRLLRELAPQMDVIRDISSGEALVEQLREGPWAALLYSEFGSMVARSKNKATALLKTKLMELYDAPRVLELRRVGGKQGRPAKVQAEEPRGGMIGVSNLAGLELTEHDLLDGFVNRMTIVMLREGQPVPIPSAFRDEAWKALIEEVRQSIPALGSGGPPRLIHFTKGGEERWGERYLSFHEYSRQLSEAQGSAIKRTPTMALKLATILAVLEGKVEIDEDLIERGWLIMKIASADTLEFVRQLGLSSYDRKAEHAAGRILDLLKAHGPALDRTFIQEKIGGNYPVLIFDQAIGLLLSQKSIRELSDPVSGRRWYEQTVAPNSPGNGNPASGQPIH